MKRKTPLVAPLRSRSVTVHLPRQHAAYLRAVARICGLPTATVAQVVLGIGVYRELQRVRATPAGKGGARHEP